MGWEKDGRYYTRSRKVNGRVVREYIGGGEVGALVAQMDAIERERRDFERECWRLEKEEMEAQMAAEAKERKEKEEMLKRGIVPLPEEERQRLLSGLRASPPA